MVRRKRETEQKPKKSLRKLGAFLSLLFSAVIFLNQSLELLDRADRTLGRFFSAQQPTPQPIAAAIPDVSPPAVSLTSPFAGANISGTITVSAHASGGAGVVGVKFLLDRAPLSESLHVQAIRNHATSHSTTGPSS
jgi:hypothetical protein